MWTVDELLTAYRWHHRQTMRRRYRYLLVGLSIFFIGAGIETILRARSHVTGWVMLSAGLYLIGSPAIRTWVIRRQFLKRPDRNSEIEWSISDDALRVTSTLGISEVRWEAFAKVIETPDGYLFYPTLQMFHWLPNSDITSDEYQRLSELVRLKAQQFQQLHS